MHTKDAVIYDPATGIVAMLVIPDDDRQLDDPAFNPSGMTHIRIAHSSGHPLKMIADAQAQVGRGVTLRLLANAGS